MQDEILKLKKTRYRTEKQADIAKQRSNKLKETLMHIRQTNEVQIAYLSKFTKEISVMADEIARRVFLAFGVDAEK